MENNSCILKTSYSDIFRICRIGMINLKIKMVLLDSDIGYMSRLVSAFSARQDCNLETYLFTDKNAAICAATENEANLFVAGDTFTVSADMLPAGCLLAYFTDSATVRVIHGCKAICRYQKAELLYKEILSAGSDFGELSERKTDTETKRFDTKICSFFPCGGGVGSSSAAAACAIHFAKSDKAVLYLNLERFGTSNAFFDAEGKLDLGDVFYAVKGKKGNLHAKLQNAIKQDTTGVYFIESCKVAPEVMEITAENIRQLLSELKDTGRFDVIIFDTDMLLDETCLSVMRSSACMILVSDGSEVSLTKLERVRKAMEIIALRDDRAFPDSFLLFNKFSSKSGRTIDDPDIPLLGGVPRFDGASASRVIRQLADMPLFDRLPI